MHVVNHAYSNTTKYKDMVIIFKMHGASAGDRITDDNYEDI